jgi:hypothetical protein
LGVILLSAATMKFRDLSWEPFGKAVLVPTKLRIILVEAEAILGLWLLLGVAARILWTIAVVFFTLLGGVSLYLAAKGEPTCGCFGSAVISPWISFAIDAMAVLALALTRPGVPRTADVALIASHNSRRSIALWAIAGLVTALFIRVSREGGLDVVWLGLVGQNISVEPAIADIGAAPAGEATIISVRLQNNSAHVVKVIGGTNNCAANATIGLPVDIPGGESRSVRVKAFYQGDPGPFVREYALYTDDVDNRLILARLSGSIKAKE